MSATSSRRRPTNQDEPNQPDAGSNGTDDDDDDTESSEPTGASKGKTKEEREAAEQERKEAVAALRALTEQEGMAAQQILRAVKLEGERADNLSRIAKNRDFLRLLNDNEALTPEQQKWLLTFYATKEKDERRSKDEVEETKKAKEAARTLASELAKTAVSES